MIHIGKTYLKRENNKSYLCSDVTIETKKLTLWFSIDSKYEDYLCLHRADAFVMALLIPATTYNYDIKCDDPISARLKYFLINQLIPNLAEHAEFNHNITIESDITTVPYKNKGAVGVGFSGGSDSLYTIMNHTKKDCEYPLTHIAVFNGVSFEKFKENASKIYLENCKAAQRFADELNLKLVTLDTNFYETLNWKFTNEISTYRNISCALALQGLFNSYLISSFHSNLKSFRIIRYGCAFYDLLTISSTSTESLNIYLSGGNADKVEKISELSNWEPSYKYLHSCVSPKEPGKKNCGICKKCKDAQIILYALGKLDNYNTVFDIKKFKENLPKLIAYYLVRSDHLAKSIVKLLEKNNIEIPSQSLIIAKQMEKVIDLKKKNDTLFNDLY